MYVIFEMPLRGAGGEPISFARTVYSHGCAQLPPATVLESPLVYRRGFRIGKRVIGVELQEHRGRLQACAAQRLGQRDTATLESAVARMFRLHDDLSAFYRQIADDERFTWATAGAGRILASPSVFEDVVKTICTTNTSWGGTTRMVNALVEHLGEKAPNAPPAGPYGRAFPTPRAMADASETFYKKVAGAGYRGPYLRQLAGDVARGRIDLERLAIVSPEALPDDEMARELQTLPGVGPYAAAHIMLMLGRYDRLILDSWTRPKYARLLGRKRPLSDRTMMRRFARYGRYAGLAFWLFLTRDWLDETADPA